MSSILWNKFETNAARHPDKAAFIFPQQDKLQTVTYQQLLDSIHRLSLRLLACRVTPGMRAALMTPPSTDFFALAFALIKLGIIPIIIDPAIGLKKAGECINECKPDIFIGNTITHLFRIMFGWGKQTIKINTSISSLLKITNYPFPPINLQSPISPLSPAAIIYTSGSTGLPKGVIYTQANFAAQLDMLQQTFNISQNEIDLPAFPLYAIIDVLLGVTSVIPDIYFPMPGKTDPQKVINAIQRFTVTNMFASPVVLDILAKYGIERNIKLPSLKRVITAGAPASTQLQKRFRNLLHDETDLFGIYGATETLPIAKIESREIFGDVEHGTAQGAGVCLGKPVDGAIVRIIEITDNAIEEWHDSLEVKPNVIGEITVQGPAVTRVYIHREEANRLAKIRNGEDVIHRMGDVGYFDAQGRLWYCGRKSHRVITNDDVMFTEQIEGIFNEHPEVYRTALVGVNKEPILWIEPKRGTNIKRDKIRQELIELAKNHPQASKIKTFLFMKKFPTDVRHNSKILREELTAKSAKVAKKTLFKSSRSLRV